MGSKTKSKKSRISKKKPYKKRVNKKKITIKNRRFRKKHYKYKKKLRTRKSIQRGGINVLKKVTEKLKMRTIENIRNNKTMTPLTDEQKNNAVQKINELFYLLENYIQNKFMEKLNKSGIPTRLKTKVISGLVLSVVSIIPAVGPLAVAIPKQIINIITTYKEFINKYAMEKALALDMYRGFNGKMGLDEIVNKMGAFQANMDQQQQFEAAITGKRS